MNSARHILPAQLAIDGNVRGNAVEQLRRPPVPAGPSVERYSRRRVEGDLVSGDDSVRVLVVGRRVKPPDDVAEVLLAEGGLADLTDRPAESARPVRWLKPGPIDIAGEDLKASASRCRGVVESWRGRFAFRPERQVAGRVVAEGLRPPQIGALHATLGHWSVTDAPASFSYMHSPWAQALGGKE